MPLSLFQRHTEEGGQLKVIVDHQKPCAGELIILFVSWGGKMVPNYPGLVSCDVGELRTLILIVLLFFVVLPWTAGAQSQTPAAFNTGVDDNNQLLPNGAVDPHYKFNGGPNGTGLFMGAHG